VTSRRVSKPILTASLHTLENDYIREEGDPRIHFALNCMAASCPRLQWKPFRAATLDQDLERLTRAFFEERRNLRIDHDNRVVHVTEMLDFSPRTSWRWPRR